MSHIKSILVLVKKEFLIEWRNMHTFIGALLYVGCTVFTIYMMVGTPDSKMWNALFWIAQLFVVVNAVSKSFQQEGLQRNRYYYTIAAPAHVIASKLIYNFIYISILAVLSLFAFRLLLGNTFQNVGMYYLVALLGSGSLAFLFTFLSAISAQAQQGAAMIAILGIPLAIPLIMILSRISLAALAPVLQEGLTTMILIVIGMECLIILLSLILYPFVRNE